jgi:metal-responsive CopG/Arc/MetJ family transcriptional regulator
MRNTDTSPKRGRGRPKQPETMSQISIRMPDWMIEALDAMNERKRFGQSDRASLIREAVAAYVEGDN